MIVLFAFVLSILVFFTLAFRARPYLGWVAAAGLLLLFWFVGGSARGLLGVVAVLYGASAILFGVPAFRKPLISRHAMRLLGPMLPHISDTERSALEAGTVWWDGELFTGNPDWQRLLDFEIQALSQEEKAFLDGPVTKLCEMTNDWEVNRTGDLPVEVWEFIKHEKFMGMIIPKKYEGLGFSAAAHSAVITKLSSRSVALAVSVMVPNSLGPAELIHIYGTEEQKQQYLPRMAVGQEIPAFALTEPGAGSDAAAGKSYGIVEKGVFQGNEVLGMRLNWDKRYITLSPIATVLGLAFKLRDPDGLLGKGEHLGITCALIPTDLPGVEATQRHDPLGVPFLNGPTFGHDVFVPLDFIIGGEKMIGQGWRMLMESLASGRSISLPGLAVGAAETVVRATGAYATLREQFGISIGRFEGVEDRLAEIVGKAYLMRGARVFVAGAVDSGERPSVISAITKAYMTEFMRDVVNNGMDVMAGAGISQGPRNVLAHAYHSIPVGITVEGANILTRSLIVYGQGSIRCHPHVQDEIESVQNGDLSRFDRAIWGHAGFVFTNIARSMVLAISGGRALAAPAGGPMAHWFGRLTRWSAGFTVLSDVLMGSLGADLKRKERISGRMADAFAWMYLGSATLKRFYDEGQRPDHALFAQWGLETADWNIQEALNAVLNNFPNRLLALKLRAWIFPLGLRAKPPSDRLESQLAHAILDGRPARTELSPDIFIPSDSDPGLGRLERCLALVVTAAPAEAKVRQAIRDKRMPSLPRPAAAEAAYKAGIITEAEATAIKAAQTARDEAIAVDAFDPGFFSRLDTQDLSRNLSV